MHSLPADTFAVMDGWNRSAAPSGWQRMSSGFVLCLWVLAGVILLTSLSARPVGRTQEARVLVTAREMMNAGWEGWLIPKTNGALRLRKPPLAYWLSAGSFRAFGVHERWGRLPMALAGWMTLGLTFATARRLFNPLAGFFAAAALFGCIGFITYVRLAETDALVLFLVTAGIYGMWRAVRSEAVSAGWWYHMASAAIGLTALTKGPPAAFPLLFLIVISVIERRWGVLWRWIRCGAPITAALIAAPWFIYVLAHPQSDELVDDLLNSAAGGRGHSELFLEYLPELAVLLAPWSGLIALACWVAVRSARSDARARGLLVWIAVTLVPLCLWGNKQPHYLLPLLPPLMILLGWLITEARGNLPQPLRAWLKGLIVLTVAGLMVAGPALLGVGMTFRGGVSSIDVVLCASMVLLAAASWLVLRKSGGAASLALLVVGWGVSVCVVVMFWQGSLDKTDMRQIAESIRREWGPHSYAFHGDGVNLPLCFYLGTVAPALDEAEELNGRLAADLDTVVIHTHSSDPAPAMLPPGLQRRRTYQYRERYFSVYTLR